MPSPTQQAVEEVREVCEQLARRDPEQVTAFVLELIRRTGFKVDASTDLARCAKRPSHHDL